MGAGQPFNLYQIIYYYVKKNPAEGENVNTNTNINVKDVS